MFVITNNRLLVVERPSSQDYMIYPLHNETDIKNAFLHISSYDNQNCTFIMMSYPYLEFNNNKLVNMYSFSVDVLDRKEHLCCFRKLNFNYNDAHTKQNARKNMYTLCKHNNTERLFNHELNRMYMVLLENSTITRTGTIRHKYTSSGIIDYFLVSRDLEYSQFAYKLKPSYPKEFFTPSEKIKFLYRPNIQAIYLKEYSTWIMA